MKRLAVVGSIVVWIVAASLAGTATPASAAVGNRIRPHQLFIGLVNGTHFQTTIAMACFGAIRPGQTGHPMAGQTVGVQRTLDIPGGNTGSKGTSIRVTIGPSTTAASAITFTRYGTQAIPTTLFLPCAGQGTARFQPAPGSAGARSDLVTVNFEGQP